jgi:hypothetical protein
MTASTLSQGPRRLSPGAAARFEPNHPWDRNFFLLYAGLIWVGIGMGFGPQIVEHMRGLKPAFPLIVHFHAAAFVGWLTLFTGQVLLIRSRRTDLHRKLGFAMLGLAVIMLILGPATAYVVQRAQFGTKDSDPAFLAVQLGDMVGFAGLIGAAVIFRNNASAHKRLILLSTLFIADAGFARWLGAGITKQLGDGYWGFLTSLYVGNDVLIAGVALYDLITRQRLHRAYLAGLAWIVALQLTAGWLYFAPAWKLVALRLIGHPA